MFTRVAPELIARLRDGEESAFRAIYEQFHGRIYRLVFSLVKEPAKTEEVVQEAFVALWLHRGNLNIEQPLYPLVYLTAKRLAIDHFRKKLLEMNAKEQVINQTAPYSNETEETIFLADLNRITDESIKSLPAQQQTVFILSRREGLSYDEIAQQLRISPNTVRNHMVSALKALRLHFSRHGVMIWWLSFLLFF